MSTIKRSNPAAADNDVCAQKRVRIERDIGDVRLGDIKLVSKEGGGGYWIATKHKTSKFLKESYQPLGHLSLNGVSLRCKEAKMNPNTCTSFAIIEKSQTNSTLYSVVRKVTELMNIVNPRKQPKPQYYPLSEDEVCDRQVYSNTPNKDFVFKKNGVVCDPPMGIDFHCDIVVNLSAVKTHMGEININVYVVSVNANVADPDPDVVNMLTSAGLDKEAVDRLMINSYRNILPYPKFNGVLKHDVCVNVSDVTVEPVNQEYTKKDDEYNVTMRLDDKKIEDLLQQCVDSLNAHLASTHVTERDFFFDRQYDIDSKNEKDKPVYYLPTREKSGFIVLKFKFDGKNTPFFDGEGHRIVDVSQLVAQDTGGRPEIDFSVASFGFHPWSNSYKQIAGVSIKPVFVVQTKKRDDDDFTQSDKDL